MSHTERRHRTDRPELSAAFDLEVRRLGSMATLLNHAVAAYAGLHETDHECLDLLDWAGPLSAGEIGVHLGLSSGAVTGLLDRLEASGWVRRERDPRDRRKVVVHLAHDRAAELWPLYQPLSEAIDAYRESLDTRELRTVVEFLEFANRTVAATTERARDLRAGTTPEAGRHRP